MTDAKLDPDVICGFGYDFKGPIPACYIAGPMRGIEDWNFPAFDNADEVLISYGWKTFSPAQHDRDSGAADDYPNARPLWEYMMTDLAEVAKSDAVFVLPGWEDSHGATLEVMVAQSLDILVFEFGTGERVGTTIEVADGISGFGAVRQFDTGATRDTDQGKLAYEGFESPFVTKRFAEYMHEHRIQSDGTLRDPDNWQRGIPIEAYVDSLVRHVEEFKQSNRSPDETCEFKAWEDMLCAIRFNVNGLLYETLQERGAGGKRPT